MGHQQSQNFSNHSNTNKDIIIHRTSNCTIFNDHQELVNRKIQREKDLKNKGWFSKDNMPYQQLGEFANVLQGIEGVKYNLPHAKANFDYQTHRNLKVMRRVLDPSMQLADPGRTSKILSQYQGQLKKLRAASQLSQGQTSFTTFNKKRFSNPQNSSKHQGNQKHQTDMFGNDQSDEEDDKVRESQLIRAKNSRLNTGSLKKLVINSNDGKDLLKNEILESNQRVLQIKHGMLIRQLVKDRQIRQLHQVERVQSNSMARDNTFLTGIDSSMKLRRNDETKIANGSKTMPNSPRQKPVRISIDNSQLDNSVLPSPGGVIYIPNYNNKKPKIIKFSDLAKLIPKGDITSTNKGYAATKRRSDYNNDAYTFSDEMKVQANNLMGNSMNKKGTNQVNYHKKLQEEFEKYELLFKEQAPIQLQLITTNQETPRTGQFINQLISNQYLNKSMRDQQNNVVGTPKRVMSRDTSVSESQSPNNFPKKYNNFKQSKLMTNTSQFQSPMHANTKTTLKVTQTKKNITQNSLSSQNNSNKDSQIQLKAYPKSCMPPQSNLSPIVEQRLTKYERDQILISAITHSIKNFDQEEEEELLASVNEDALWKECTFLLKDFFNFNFLNELKENKILIFRLYKLYLLHSLFLSMKQIDDSQNLSGNNRNQKKNRRISQMGQMSGQEETNNANFMDESSDDEQNYRGHNGSEAFKQKMTGFIRLLQDILNPAEKDALELDSVFQLKSLVKSYYEKKGELAGNLTETLYAMMQERPQIMQSKKKFFFTSYEGGYQQEAGEKKHYVKKIRNLYFELEQMRINAERERISNYKDLLEQLLNSNNSKNLIMRALHQSAINKATLSQHISPQSKKTIAGYFQAQKLEEIIAAQQKQKEKELQQKEQKRKKLLTKKALGSIERREAWVNEAINNDELVQGYQKGALVLYHQDNHKFRDFQSSGISGSQGTALKTGNSTILNGYEYNHQDYNSKLPSTHNNFRDRYEVKEIANPFMKQNPHCDRERVQESINTSPRCQTEGLNTLLLARPKFREFDSKKWVAMQDFKSQNSPGETWEPIKSTSVQYQEPYIERVVNFRSTFTEHKKSQDLLKFDNNQDKQLQQMFDSTIPKDKTWQQRTSQSMSLRQRKHMNLSLKVKASHAAEMQQTPQKLQGIYTRNLYHLEEPDPHSGTTPDKKVIRFFQKQDYHQELTKIMSEASPKHTFSPVKIKEKVVSMNSHRLDDAAQYLNNNFNKSFTNSWQYKVIKPLQNKKFSEKIELNESHIINELDKVKTYYGSILEKLQIDKLKSYMSSEKTKPFDRNFSPNSERIQFDLNKVTKRHIKSTQPSPMNRRATLNSGNQEEIRKVIQSYFEKLQNIKQDTQQ